MHIRSYIMIDRMMRTWFLARFRCQPRSNVELHWAWNYFLDTANSAQYDDASGQTTTGIDIPITN